METKKQHNDRIEIAPAAWKIIHDAIKNADEYRRQELGEGLELRFTPMRDNTYSVVVAFEAQDLFHFMWQEVSGLVNVSHRIVNKKFRGRGMATDVLYALEQRVQRLSNRDHCRYSLMIETSQLSVLHLGLKRGMAITRGAEAFQKITGGDKAFQVQEGTHVSDEKGYRLSFRISKAFAPVDVNILQLADTARGQILAMLRQKAA